MDSMSDDTLTIGGRAFGSRLFVGTGKYKDVEETRLALRASGASVVTVAVRRVDLTQTGKGSMFGMLRAEGFTLLPDRQGQLDTRIKQLPLFVTHLQKISSIANLPARRFNQLPFCSIHLSVITFQFASSPPS